MAQRRHWFNGHFPGQLGLSGKQVTECLSILDFTGAKDDGGDGDNWSYRSKTCKASRGVVPFINENENENVSLTTTFLFR